MEALGLGPDPSAAAPAASPLAAAQARNGGGNWLANQAAPPPNPLVGRRSRESPRQDVPAWSKPPRVQANPNPNLNPDPNPDPHPNPNHNPNQAANIEGMLTSEGASSQATFYWHLATYLTARTLTLTLTLILIQP